MTVIVLIALGILFVRGDHVSNSQTAALEQAQKNRVFSYTSHDFVIHYLEQSSLVKPNFGGKVFVAYEDLGNTTKGLFTEQYVWAHIQEYYVENGVLKEGTGASLPLLLTVKKNGNTYVIINYEAPGDGAAYSQDIKRIFPESTQELILGQDSNHTLRVQELVVSNRVAAQAHFELH